jgi:iron(III) transport system substrate-binding protein
MKIAQNFLRTLPKRSKAFVFACLGLTLSSTLLYSHEISSKTLTLYTTREPKLLQPTLELFKEKTGIEVHPLFFKEGLAERVAAEGPNSPADVFLIVDIGVLTSLVDKGVTKPFQSKRVLEAVPVELRDSKDHWTAVSMRARVLYAKKDLQVPSPFSYEDLAKPEWKGKICVRSGQHPYNLSLVAAYLDRYGEEETLAWLKGIKANLARKPSGGDREVARDILGGLCEVGLGNSYYVALMRKADATSEQRAWGEAITVILPEFRKEGGGTHINISGVALAKNSKNPDLAQAFLDFLVSEEAQRLYAHTNNEYPVRVGVDVDPIIASFGPLKKDNISLHAIADKRKEASQLVDRAGFDD